MIHSLCCCEHIELRLISLCLGYAMNKDLEHSDETPLLDVRLFHFLDRLILC